jgi:hypothetical protein
MPSWKKVITSGSDASLNSLNVTSGVTITGSLNVTGSTTQVGNNTLLGNTLLSGSLTISGSTTPGSPSASVQIYGDIRQSGYHRFDPVTTNINTSVTASYIYVSGSTNDLYFSQNGSGYNNVTRLRWLEGNLYTGLLHGGLITTQSSTVYQISSGSGIIVNLNASLADDPYPVVQFLEWPNLSASIAPLTASYQQAFVGIDATNNIFAQGTPFSNGQFDSIINIGGVFFQNQSTINGFKTQPSVAYGFEQQQNTFNRAFGPLKLSGYTLAASGSSTGSLIVASGTAYAPGSNYIVDPNEPYYAVDNGTNVSKIFRYRQSGSTWVYDTNAGAGYATIDPTQYSNNGVLTAVPGGGSNRQWSIQRVFWFPNSVIKAIVVYYGNATYTTELDAIANISFESFVEAPNTSANAIYLGAIVVRNNADFTNTDSYKIQPGGLFRQVGGSGGGGSIITQTLSGLSDVLISGPTNGQALVYDNTAAKWQNSSTLTANLTGNASTATSASFASTASYVQTAQTASYVLQAVSASFASTASYVNTLNQIVRVGNDIELDNQIGAIVANSFDAGLGNVFIDGTSGDVAATSFTAGGGAIQIDGITGEVTAITFIGDLTGTASYATQALSASWAPAGNPFPYTGSAEISGSLGVTGSFSLQTFNGLTDVTALDFSGVTRAINDVFGSTSINADDRELYDSNTILSTNWEIRRLIDTSTNRSLDWEYRYLQDAAGTVTVDWASLALYDNNATYALNWNDRDLYDSSAINSVNWEARRLIDSSGVIVMRWDQHLTYDTVNSQSIDWNNRQLKFDNGSNDYTVDWSTGILQDTATKASIDWQNRQLKDINADTILNWSSGVAITGSALVSGSLTVTGSLTVSGSSTFTNIGPAQFSGSFGIQGAGDGYDFLPVTAITIDDANYTRTLHDFLTGASSLDFGNRLLLDSAGVPVLQWEGSEGYINSGLYSNNRINATTRNTLLTFQARAGQTLDEVTFDSTVADFDLVYLSTGSTWFPVDQATDSSTKLLGICLRYDPESGLGTVILEGDVSVSTSAGTAPVVDNANYGLPVYIAEGAGNTMDTTIPVDGYVRVLGHCYHTDDDDNWIMKFRPSNDWIEV